jgi:predicted AAA+ superfamily ATPase
MPCLLELPTGIHVAVQSGLRFHLDTPLALPPKSWLILEGENGSGKSTFLEHVLIPGIRASHRILYLAQDMDLERTAMAATLALLGHDVPTELPNLTQAWIKASVCRDTIILDEFDKYLNPDQMDALNLDAFSWIIAISHLNQPQNRHGQDHGFRLALQRDSASSDVRLQLEKAW